MVNDGGTNKGKKRQLNSNSNVENITNAVAELRRRYGITTREAMTLVKNMPGPSRRHRAVSPPNTSDAAQRVMGSDDLLHLLGSKMNSRQLAMFATMGKQQRAAAKHINARREMPKMFNTAHGGTRSKSRLTTLANRKTLGLVEKNDWRSRMYGRARHRITTRMPGYEYQGTTRERLLAGLKKHVGYRLFGYASSRRMDNRGWRGVTAFTAKLRESLYALTLNSGEGSSVARDLQRFIAYLDGEGVGRDSVMHELEKLGKMALYIIAVHMGVKA